MHISVYFDTYPGMYMAQAFCHSVIAFIMVERAITLWKINSPLIRQRFGLLVILLPIFSFPLYQLINPDRASIAFRLGALFDINRWLNLELGGVPLGALFIIIVFVTTLIFLLQEMVPVLRHTFESKRSGLHAAGSDNNPAVTRAVEQLSAEKPDIFTLDDDEFILFSSTGKNPAIFISTGIIETLSAEQLRAVVAHEIAHIKRNRKPLLLMAFLLRMTMFFNPVVLLEFRRIVQEEEKICDDMAVLSTKDPAALSEALQKLYYRDDVTNPLQLRRFSGMRDSLEEYSHNVQIGNRIARLEYSPVHGKDGKWAELIVTVIIIVGINYFVV
ncbi:MAG: M48 family metalloprotease [Nitrospirae bacterium]|nr:M48 family metalloprotease [Nitrospirota bacterium]